MAHAIDISEGFQPLREWRRGNDISRRARREPKDAATLPDGDVALADLTNLVFQNTQVTWGTTTVAVTAADSATEMGRIGLGL